MVFEKRLINIIIKRPPPATPHAFGGEGYVEPYYSIKFVGKPIVARVIEGARRLIEYDGSCQLAGVFVESESVVNEVRFRERQMIIYLRNKFPELVIDLFPYAGSHSELVHERGSMSGSYGYIEPLVIRGDEYLVASPHSRLSFHTNKGNLHASIEQSPLGTFFARSYELTSPAKLRHASMWCAKDLSPADLMFDLDGTLRTFQNKEDGGEPIQDAISVLKIAYDSGHRIIIKTARGFKGGKRPGYFAARRILKQVKQDLADLGVPYHEILYCVNYADVYVDDFSVNPLYYSIDKATGFYFRE